MNGDRMLGKFSSVLAALAALLLALAPPLALSQEGYATVRASPDGIGKAYMGREIAHVMSYHGAPWLERPERMTEERPDLVLAALDLKRGMVVADLGAGSGYYPWRIGERVGKVLRDLDQGRVER